MKRLFLLVSICIICSTIIAQPTLQTKLYYTAKVWGFAKYYHSRVSTCQVNWDSVLVKFLPLVKSAATSAQFNDALDSILLAAGPMAIATTPPPAVLPVELRRNLNFGWIADAALRTDVQTTLNNIKDNFRPHASCYVDYVGYSFVFPKDSVSLNINTTVSYPGEYDRLLMLFKYWNILNYFNPYNYVLDKPWDSSLYNYVIPFDTASNAYSLYLQLDKLATDLNDAHVEGLTYSYNYFQPPGYYMPGLRLKFIEGKYVVIKSKMPGIYAGDAIISIDGMTTQQWEDSLKQYNSVGSLPILRRNLSVDILARNNFNASETLVVEDSNGNTHTYTVNCNNYPASNQAFYYDYYYPVDSLIAIKWSTLRCDIGYVNMENITNADIAGMYAVLRTKAAIIFDLRNYPQGTAWGIADLMYPNAKVFGKFTKPDVTYPGTHIWEDDILGINNNPDYYPGKVIILMNEETQSQAEFSCMILGAMPNVVKIGSHTAGTDGNVTYWKLTQDIRVGFTGLGVFYPNGDSTQRIGIVPDVNIEPTRAGIRQRRDEVLERALFEVGCFPASIKHASQEFDIKIYPNPANDVLHIDSYGINTPYGISITDITGKALLEQQSVGNAALDIRGLAPGIHLVTLNIAGNRNTIKFVKQ